VAILQLGFPMRRSALGELEGLWSRWRGQGPTGVEHQARFDNCANSRYERNDCFQAGLFGQAWWCCGELMALCTL
jgi:hypothetical protein